MDWTTKALPEFSQWFEVEELHLVIFEPERWPEDRPLVALEIPGLSLCLVVDGIPLPHVDVVSMSKDTNLREAVHRACKEAVVKQALIWFTCDTAEQAEQVARLAARWLPTNYRRQALERHQPEARERRKLS